MRNVPNIAVLLIGLSAVAACARDEPDQNIMVDNQAAAPADIEALPPDESSATPSDELVNGAVEDNAAMDNLANSY